MGREEITVHSDRGHILEIGGKFYKLYKEDKDEEGRTVKRQVYKEINKEDYIKDLEKLAAKIKKETSVGVEEIIFDALKDLPLERISKIEDAILEAQDKSKKQQEEETLIKKRQAVREKALQKEKDESFSRRYSGGCIELKIGGEYLVLRE